MHPPGGIVTEKERGDVMRRSMFALAVIAALLPPGLAIAKGTVKVQQVDGSIQSYPNSTLKIVGKTLRITTADKKGTLIITDAACSYVDKLLRCLPYAALLQQRGTYPITIAGGTLWFNTTNTNQPLKYSSTQVRPNGVLGIMRSKYGTYVTITGELDGRSQ